MKLGGCWRLLALAVVWTGAGTILIARGADMRPDQFFSDAQLAAFGAAQAGQTERLSAAARAGAVDLNRPGREDMTLLGLAVLKADRRAIISLMRAGADANQVIRSAGSPAVLAITKYANPPLVEALAGLVEGGYDLNHVGPQGQPYLFYFVDYIHWPGLKFALEHGGNINAQSSGGESLLTYLIEGGDVEQARALIGAGADVTLRGNRNESALRAVESKLRRAEPAHREKWRELLALRELILSKLSNPDDRRTVFSEVVEKKIRNAER